MKQTSPDVNRILLHGRAAQPPALSHHNHDVDFFTVPVLVSRLSGAADQVNAVISRALLEQHGWLERGDELTVRGEVRTFNNRTGVGSRLVISVFVRELLLEQGEDQNRLVCTGTLCKPPSLRCTPSGPHHLRYDPGGKPALWPLGLSSLHRLGQPGLPVRPDGGGGEAGTGGAAPEPGVHKKFRRPHARSVPPMRCR